MIVQLNIYYYFFYRESLLYIYINHFKWFYGEAFLSISDSGISRFTPKRAINIKNNDTCNNIISGTVVRMRKSGKQKQLHMVKSKK